MKIANRIRADICKMMSYSKSSHIGSALSIVDILKVLYFDLMNIQKIKDHAQDRDVFILSKGHASAALYSVLAQAGIIEKELLNSYYIDGGILPGHLDMTVAKGIEVSAGSLGHGPGLGLGIAIGKLKKGLGGHVYVLVGDGECNEGSVWESIMLAGTLKVHNYTLIIDNNRLQGMGGDIINQNNLAERLKTFGLNVVEIDGHDEKAIKDALINCSGPAAIVANTIKGKGVSFMEGEFIWHYKSPDPTQLNMALDELGESI